METQFSSYRSTGRSQAASLRRANSRIDRTWNMFDRSLPGGVTLAFRLCVSLDQLIRKIQTPGREYAALSVRRSGRNPVCGPFGQSGAAPGGSGRGLDCDRNDARMKKKDKKTVDNGVNSLI